jgi:hypothetical protein
MRFLIAFFLLLPLLAWGQIYQYIDPETGAKKLTNVPPSWYSADKRQSGPRTLLIVRGEVVDDTRSSTDALAIQQAFQRASQEYAAMDQQRSSAAAARAEPKTALAARTPFGQMMESMVRAQAAAAREGIELRWGAPPPSATTPSWEQPASRSDIEDLKRQMDRAVKQAADKAAKASQPSSSAPGIFPDEVEIRTRSGQRFRGDRDSDGTVRIR